jgi:integrase
MNAAPRELKTIHDVIMTYLPQARRDMADHAYYERQRLLEKIDRDLGQLNIADAKPFDLHNWLNEHTEYRSPWSVQHVITSVKRAFNYCLEMELIIRNPFARIKKPKGQRRRPLTDQEYQTLLRGSDPQLRRLVVFLAMSGCRPAEATGMKWDDVHFDQNSVILKIHKTSKATGRPRRIPLVPATVKLLLWCRRHRQTATIELVESALRRGPVKAWELAGIMKQYGVTYNAVQRARIAMGVIRKRVRPGSPDWTGADLTPEQQSDLRIVEAWRTSAAKVQLDPKKQEYTLNEAAAVIGINTTTFCTLVTRYGLPMLGKRGKTRRYPAETIKALLNDKRVGPRRTYAALAQEMGLTEQEIEDAVERHRKRRDSYLVYMLPPGYRSPVDSHAQEFVFLNGKGNPWNRSSLGCAMRRVRQRTGILPDAKMYGLRHRYGLRGIKNKVNLKLLSLAMGHCSTVMTEYYVAEAGLTEEVQEAALQIVYGPGATAVPVPVTLPKQVHAPQAPPIEQVQPETNHLPGRHALGRDRPQVQVNGAGESKTEILLGLLLKKLGGQVPAGVIPHNHNGHGDATPLKPAQERAYRAWEAALKENPKLVKAKDRDVFEWMLTRPEYAIQIPHHFETAYRYIAAGRKFYGCVKRPRKERR